MIGDGVIQHRISGGTHNEEYVVTTLINTTQGDILEGDGLLVVREIS